MQVRLQDLITQLITTTLHLISDNDTASLTAINLVITIDKKNTSLLPCWRSRGKAPCLHAHLGLGNHGGHENIGQTFVLDLHLFGLQGVGSRQEHIFFSGKQATKEIDREVASSSLLITRLTPPLSSKKGTASPLFLLVSLVLASTK